MNGKESLKIIPRVVAYAGAMPFRREIEDSFNGLSRAEELQNQGYGLNVLYSHPSRRDPLEMIKLILGSSIMRKRPIVIPIAFHQYKRLFVPPGKALDITLYPIVTQETINKGLNRGYPLGHGEKEYFEKAIKTLREGGINILAPQAERQESLGIPAKPTVGTFMIQAHRKHLDKYAFLFVGIGIKGAEDYKREHVGGLNPFKTYQVSIGPTFTKEEVMEAVNGNYREVDSLVFEQLRGLVSLAYKTPTTSGVR